MFELQHLLGEPGPGRGLDQQHGLLLVGVALRLPFGRLQAVDLVAERVDVLAEAGVLLAAGDVQHRLDDPEPDRAHARRFHIRRVPDPHRRLRICYADHDATIRDDVVELLARELADPPGARGGSSAMSRKRDRGGEGDAE